MDAVSTIGEEQIRFVAVYVPASSTDTGRYLEELRRSLTNFPSPLPLFIGGDWNCVQDPSLDSAGPDGRDQGKIAMDEMVTSLSLFDPFRVLYPHKRLFTNIRSLN